MPTSAWSAGTPRRSAAPAATPSSRSRRDPTSAMLPGIDPPRHVQYRKLINQGFTVRNVQRLEPHMRKVARDIVADITEKGEFDAVPDISAEMSLQVIADVLGVPAEDRMDVFRWSNAIGSLGIEDPDYAPTPQALGQAAAEMFSYCGELVAAPAQTRPDRRHPVGAAGRRGRRREAQPRPAQRVLPAAGHRRQRDHPQHAQPRHPGALAAPRPAGPAGARPRRRQARRGGAASLGHAGDALPPHRHPRRRDRAGSRSPPGTGC